MTTPNGDYWSRDPVADANPDLTRKRLRLSEENETSPRSSDDSIVIEALPPEPLDPGDNIDNAIELHDDEALIMEPFNQSFQIYHGDHSADAQLRNLLNVIRGTQYIGTSVFASLAEWLSDHVESDVPSRVRSVAVLKDAYLGDQEFFSLLATVLVAILERQEELFEEADFVTFSQDKARLAVKRFLAGATELSLRMLHLLPDVMDVTISRRDSGQTNKTRQSIGLFAFMRVLTLLLDPESSPALKSFAAQSSGLPLAYANDTKNQLLEKRANDMFAASPRELACIMKVLDKLARCHREITNAWEAIDSALRITRMLDLQNRPEPEQVVEVIHMFIMPVVSEKHPRALPFGFHDMVVDTARTHLLTLMSSAGAEEAACIYDRYVRADQDALLTEPQSHTMIAGSLQTVSEGDHGILAQLMTTAWMLQGLKQYIYSDIMDIRNYGINILGTLLVQLHECYRPVRENAEHPVLQYVARFLRANELTKYIFGPNSHASLVNHSQRIICFLAVTFSYTNLETDIIWHACTNSVEAEFVKASLSVFTELCRFLDLDQLLYLARKFTTTPPSKLSKDAVDSLVDVFHKIDIHNDKKTDQNSRLATAFISIDIMLRLDSTDGSLSMVQLRETAVHELMKFTQTSFSTDDRVEIYDRCVPNIIAGNERATASIEVLAIFLQNVIGTDESEALLARVNVSTAVRELGMFVTRQRGLPTARAEVTLRAIGSRIDAIMRLMALSHPYTNDTAKKDLFRYAFGESALSNTARDHAWNILVAMRSKPELREATQALLNRFLTVEATTLPSHLITPGLVHLFAASLQQEAIDGSFGKDFSLILDTIIWRTLLDTAKGPPSSSVTQMAAESIMTILFNFPQRGPARATAAQCHAEFARRQIDCILAELTSDQAPEKQCQERVVQEIRLLDAVAGSSREHASVFCPSVEPELDLSSGSDESFQCTVRVYGGGQSQQKHCQLRATKETLLSELADALPNVTGASENRVIIGGKVFNNAEDASKSLVELGVEALGVISICPKHSPHSELPKVLTTPGTVEYEVLARYDELEKLLDGPDEIAQQTFTFLNRMKPPQQARNRVQTSSVTAQALCPPGRLWRSVYYLHVLHQHLMDFASIGVVDESFVLRGVQLLTDILNDETRPLLLELHLRCMDILTAFLQEQPTDVTTSTIIACPSQLISRIVSICYDAIERPATDTYARRFLTERAFKLLQQALRRQPSAWTHFMSNDQVPELHARLLFDHDALLAGSIMTMIKNFCADADSPAQVADFFLRTVLQALPTAMQRADRADLFFGLATSILLQNKMLPNDESRARSLTGSLLSTLWGYQHTERIEFAPADTIMAGLLQLLTEAVNIVKSFKKSLGLPAVCNGLYNKLLFPAQIGYGHLVHPYTRGLVLRLVMLTCETREEYEGLLDATIQPLRRLNNEPRHQYPGRSGWIRPVSQCSGLVNLGMTCYMNSMLQQLFANVHFRRFLFSVPIEDSSKQQLLLQVQNLFARMQDGFELAMDTTELAKVLGIQTDSQEDVHGFYADFLSRLESNMPDDKSRSALGRFFTGKLITQIKGECGHVSPRTEPFVDLPIVVKNKSSLHESLSEFVQGEPMEGANQYKCSKCDETSGGRLVNAMRRSCPEEMPDNLTFCLKRFTFEAMLGTEGKVNDRFEFPQSIDMSRYTRAHLENPSGHTEQDIYELVGVIVHQGTLQLGHYWSYTLIRNTADSQSRVWVKLEDRNVTTCADGIEEVQRECLGGLRYSNGNERVDNAYVLFYQRKACLEEPLSEVLPVVDPTSQLLIPARIEIPVSQKPEMWQHNEWNHHLAHMFDDDFALFAEFLLKSYKQYRTPPSPQLSESSLRSDSPPDPPSEAANNSSTNSLAQKMADVSMVYLQRVAVCDTNPVKRMRPWITGLSALISEEPSFSACVLKELDREPVWLYNVMFNAHKDVRSQPAKLVLKSLDTLRSQDRSRYAEVFSRLRGALVAPLVPADPPKQMDALYLDDYLACVAGLASFGREETIAILDDGYWSWVMELLAVPWTQIVRKRHPGAFEWLKKRQENVSALYDFLYNLLDGPVAIPDFDDFSPEDGAHIIAENGVLLRKSEIEQLFHSSASGKQANVPYWLRSSTLVDTVTGWKDSSPGKLVGLLVESKAPEPLVETIEQALLKHVEDEEESLPSMLHLVLNFCNYTQDTEAERRIWQQVARVIPMWDNCEGEFLAIIEDAFELMPVHVVQTLDLWVVKYINNKATCIRDDTEKFLADNAFKLEGFDQGFDDLDALGIRQQQARSLVKALAHVLEKGYTDRKTRSRFESSIKALQHVKEYLHDLREEVATRLTSDDPAIKKTVTSPLRTEYAETNATMKILDRLSGVLAHWPAEPSIPAARSSIELDSDDELETDDENDWSGSEMQP